MFNFWQKLIVALDLDDRQKIEAVVDRLLPKVKKFKIGPVAFLRFGPEIITWAISRQADIFLDFKLFDIPNTMLESAKALVDLGAWSFTVHLKAGKESLTFLSRELAGYCDATGKRKPLIFGVSELTSTKTEPKQVLRLAAVAREAQLDGVVCSVWEAKKVKQETGLLTITPGIRKEPACDDQKRTATLKEAVEAGADYVVVGRPLVKSPDPLAAAKGLAETI